MSRRPFQVLPFTLSELFVLLFFVLALALANEVRKRSEVEAERTELREAVAPLGVETVRALGSVVPVRDSIPDDFQELVRRVAEQERWRPEVERQLREAGGDSARIADAPTEALIRELAGVSREVVERVERLEELAGLRAEAAEAGESPEERLLEERERLIEETERLAAEADRQRGEAERADRENRDLRAQVASLVRRTGTGMDHPPCWADAEGRIEYAFEATLHTSRVDLRPIWPRHRDRDAREIPGMTAAGGEGLTYGELSRRALPILRWSQQQEPSCRHFVRILDRVDGGKDAFKAGLLTVERYFYKLLVD